RSNRHAILVSIADIAFSTPCSVMYRLGRGCRVPAAVRRAWERAIRGTPWSAQIGARGQPL
ncbi:MAG: hypothetical protein JSU86_08790, partial [Phycisphaerales bacterium]